MKGNRTICLGLLGLLVAISAVSIAPSAQQERRPNILVIMDDDVGLFDIDAYNQGRMAGKTPIPDKLASLNNGVMS
jgi:arylsulfatase